jgi:xylulokinase
VAAFTITKLVWLAAHEPDLLGLIGAVVLPHDYLTYRLTGRRVTDRGDASGTGYFATSEGRWLPALLERFVGPAPWMERLPEVLAPTAVAGLVQAGEPRDLLLTQQSVVGPGTGDNMAAALGIGLRPGEACMSLGTSGTVFAVSSQPASDPTGIVAGFADAAGRYLPLVCTLNATKVTAAIARLLGVGEAELSSLASGCASGAGGLVLIPYFDGERTPNLPDAAGTISGLRTDVSREQLARAAFEGVVCGLLDGLDALGATVDVGSDHIVLVGGGARSVAYRQILADLSGRAVTVPGDAEHAAAGACVQAAAVLHDCPIEEIQRCWNVRGGTIVEPDPSVDRGAVRAAYAHAAAGRSHAG